MANVPHPPSQQVALVTGASRGLGATIATSLARSGATVAALARGGPELAAVVDAIGREGGSARAYEGDVADVADAQRLVDRVERDLGAITLLVNNAGTLGPIGPFADVDEGDWWRVFEVNVRGAAAMMRAVVQRMMLRGDGRVVNVTSGAGTTGFSYFSAYVASKTALVRLTECAAAELAPYGVKVFSIEPGTVRTAMSTHSIESADARRWIPWFRGIFDHGLDSAPEKVAQRVLDLAAGKGDALTGHHLPIGDDLEALAREAERIRGDGKYLLRLSRLAPLAASNPALASLRVDGESPSRAVLQLRTTLAMSPAETFRVWTHPTEIARWFLPNDEAEWIEHPTADATAGGRFEWLLRSTGETFRLYGHYESLMAPSSLAMAWSWESSDPGLRTGHDTRASVQLTQHTNGCDVLLTHEGFSSVQARDRHIAGWRRVLSRMGELYGRV